MLLECNRITKFFPGQAAPVLDQVSFALDEGERVGIIGPSGSGKSTFARVLARLEQADSGSITFNGATVCFGGTFDQRQARAAWLDMQMVFQNPEASFSDHMSVGKAIWEGAAYHPVFTHCTRKEREEKVAHMLDMVGLDPSFAGKRIFELSGGEAQRASIARAIISDPKLIICDEATSALDVTVQARIMDLLQRLYRDCGMAILFISHDLALVHNFCDRIYSL